MIQAGLWRPPAGVCRDGSGKRDDRFQSIRLVVAKKLAAATVLAYTVPACRNDDNLCGKAAPY